MADYTNTNTNAWAAMPQSTPAPYGADGALDWDCEITSEGGEFTLLPDGDYPFTVTKFERQRFDGSAKLPPCNKAELTLSVDGGGQHHHPSQPVHAQKMRMGFERFFPEHRPEKARRGTASALERGSRRAGRMPRQSEYIPLKQVRRARKERDCKIPAAA